MKKIILHIGSPKTGSSTLQSLFNKILKQNYIGVGSREAHLNEEIINFVRGERQNINDIQNDIYKLLDKNQTLLYSDERVLFEYTSENNWKQQLKKLFDVFNLNQVELSVVIGVRDPVDALPSLYQQMRNIKSVCLLSLQEFVNTRQASIFNYEMLKVELFKIGFKDLKYFDFKSLSDEKVDLTSFCIYKKIKIQQIYNKSNRSENERFYNYTLADFVRRNLGFFSNFFPSKLKIKVAKMLKFNIRREKIKTDVIIPEGIINAYKNIDLPLEG
ncbi:sulfotransferase domain-containing protein [Psychroflexus sp. MES1-P1E]|uniref:sulfotransferase domain-containing protein n=1 Tax=Psychroflexus sp. MES1-P1E TaxID=2058320 RepID=UPI000C7DDAB2|nr:sulfotransferase domain-containing protein [Psychroflexus sp. MES1-P1E]PKG43429.1 hypothetical protein CXF67_05025 [Psychroflexus sp. MES1-P1E]